MNFTVRPVEKADRLWVLEIIRGWGADFIISRGRKIFAAELPAFLAETDSESGRRGPRIESGAGCLPATEKGPDAWVDVGRNQPASGGFDNSPSERLGLVTYEIIGEQCEVVTLDAFTQFAGVGTALMHRVIDEARAQGCRRVWLITTNDNLDAIRFYQKRGFTIAAVHVNAIAHSRTLKPSIPLIGNYGIPIRDEVEFEMWL